MSTDIDSGNEAFVKKLEQMYQNYGIDTSNMSDDEFERLRKMYRRKGRDIDKDLKDSEKFKDRFENDIV